MPRMNIFVPITKMDVENRIVHGVAAQEVRDRSGEIMDYETSKPNFAKWSEETHTATGGLSKGNLRAMHGRIAAGKLDAIHFHDADKSIEIAAKVVDDNEWEKCLQGVYTGFSMGGSYAKRWADKADGTMTRYTAAPQEISLVDRPCIPTATFSLVKADGAVEAKPFKSVVDPKADKLPDNAVIASKATELAKAAGAEKDWPKYIEAAVTELTKADETKVDLAKAQEAWDKANVDLAPVIEPEAAATPEELAKAAEIEAAKAKTPVEGDEWEQVWLSKRDGQWFRKKDELRAHHAELDAVGFVDKASAGATGKLAELGELVGLEKRSFNTDQRKHASTTGAALPDGSFPIENREDVKNAVAAYGRAKDKVAAKKHIMARASAMQAMDLVPNEWTSAAKVLEDAIGGLKKFLGEETYDATTAMAALGHMHDALHSELRDDNPNSDQITALRDSIARIKDFISSEIKENHDDHDPAMTLAAAIDGLAKRGARNSKEDAGHIQRAHDACCAAGADCTGMGKAAGDGVEPLSKVIAERDALTKRVSDMDTTLGEILARVKTIEKTPLPLPLQIARTSAVSKGDEMLGGNGGIVKGNELEEILSTPEGQRAMADVLIKAAQTKPAKLGLAR